MGTLLLLKDLEGPSVLLLLVETHGFGSRRTFPKAIPGSTSSPDIPLSGRLALAWKGGHIQLQGHHYMHCDQQVMK